MTPHYQSMRQKNINKSTRSVLIINYAAGLFCELLAKSHINYTHFSQVNAGLNFKMRQSILRIVTVVNRRLYYLKFNATTDKSSCVSFSGIHCQQMLSKHTSFNSLSAGSTHDSSHLWTYLRTCITPVIKINNSSNNLSHNLSHYSSHNSSNNWSCNSSHNS